MQISEADAKAEGVYFYGNDDPDTGYYKNYEHPDQFDDFGLTSAAESFATLWNSIYGKDAFQLNPFVWVISFKVVQPEETGDDDMPKPNEDEMYYQAVWSKLDHIPNNEPDNND